MKHPVCQYYKCPETGIEMNFTKHREWGWCISFPREQDLEKLDKAFSAKIPWPELSKEEQEVVDANYQKLHEDIEKEEQE